jgi:hypothetical protein
MGGGLGISFLQLDNNTPLAVFIAIPRHDRWGQARRSETGTNPEQLCSKSWSTKFP